MMTIFANTLAAPAVMAVVCLTVTVVPGFKVPARAANVNPVIPTAVDVSAAVFTVVPACIVHVAVTSPPVSAAVTSFVRPPIAECTFPSFGTVAVKIVCVPLRVRPAISLTERFGSYGLMVRCPVCHSGNMTTDKTLALHYTAHVVMPGLGESVTDMNVGIEDA